MRALETGARVHWLKQMVGEVVEVVVVIEVVVCVTVMCIIVCCCVCHVVDTEMTIYIL